MYLHLLLIIEQHQSTIEKKEMVKERLTAALATNCSVSCSQSHNAKGAGLLDGQNEGQFNCPCVCVCVCVQCMDHAIKRLQFISSSGGKLARPLKQITKQVPTNKRHNLLVVCRLVSKPKIQGHTHNLSKA